MLKLSKETVGGNDNLEEETKQWSPQEREEAKEQNRDGCEGAGAGVESDALMEALIRC